MKKIILIIIAITTTNSLYAQLDKKTWLFGGSGSFGSTFSTVNYTTNVLNGDYGGKSGNSREFNLNLSPSIGYFLLDKFAIGIKPNILWRDSKVDYNSYTQFGSGYNRDLLIGPFVRYYFLKKEKSFNLLLESSYQLGVNKVGNYSTGKINNFSILTGTSLYFNPTVGLEFLIGYNRNFKNYKYDFDIPENTLNSYTYLQKGLQFSIGLQFHLQKR
ncbi:MAG: hypothetical protein EAZ51_07805 [Sphingobacteriales bacterium]|nr:MAG: hypothetical protein EAZ64_05525 [Sphingobacteriales bacterium]TAF79333.1 MAG: hypothetical protein EAZ51_07805 [Sphingobacteriales bacterium]